MFSGKICTFLLLLVAASAFADTRRWTYKTGWDISYPSCGGGRQSPIDIREDIVDHTISYGRPVKFNRYDVVPVEMQLENNGQSAVLTAAYDVDTPTISSGPFREEYIFSHLHFHWGTNDNVGSEHLSNGKAWPIEVHVVHYKSEYGSMTEAVKYPDGLSVIALFGKKQKVTNPGLQKVVNVLKSIRNIGNKVDIEPFPLSSLLFGKGGPTKSSNKFYMYDGSLTTPPCHEAVIWLLKQQPISIKDSALKAFRTLGLSQNDDHNYRPVQPINGRKLIIV